MWRGFDSKKKGHIENSRELVAIATADFSILATFANLKAKNAEIMYFTRSLLPNGLRKFYKNNYITTKPHLRPFQNGNIYFDNISICVIMFSLTIWCLRWYCVPNTKLASFVVLLSQNYQHLFEKQYMHLIVNFPRTSKIALKFEVGQAVLDLLIKTILWLFRSIT